MTSEGQTPDVLRTREAGGMFIRGTAVRLAGYVAGVSLLAATSILLLRHLGVEDFGRYVTVTAVVAIVGGVTEAGLGVVGSRELAVREPGAERRRLLGSLLGMRLLLTPLGVLGATAFSLLAGYGETMVVGTVLAGLGLLLLTVHGTLTLPLVVELKNGRVAAFDLIKQALTAVGVAACVLAGASLLPFFAIPIGVGLVALALTPLFVSKSSLSLPRLDRDQMRMLFREALPVAIAFALGILYFRIVIVMMSLLTDETETGLFGTSFRMLEILIGIPTMVVGIVLPLLSAAVADGAERYRYAIQRLTETALLAAVFIALVVCALAEPVILLLGGEEYRGAVPILRIQVLALIGIFLSQLWSTALVARRRQRDIVVVNAAALAAMFVLALVLIPAHDATGAAIATVAGDTLLAALTFLMLRRADRAVRPRLGFAWRVLAVGGAAALPLLLLETIGAIPVALLATAVFAAGARLLGVLPQEIAEALLAPLARLRTRSSEST